MNGKIEANLVGVAGEYLVAGELSLRGYIASITLRNTRGIDIIASYSDGSKSVSIQVKTNSSGSTTWVLSKKSELFYSDNHYYILVGLNGIGNRPSYYIVPSKYVANYIYTDHREWLKGTKSDGSPRKDSSIRNFRDPAGEYLEAWHLLG